MEKMDTNFGYENGQINMELLQNLGTLAGSGDLGLNDISSAFGANGGPEYSYEGDHPYFEEREIIAKEWISAINPDEEEEFEPGDTKDKRGNYKCGRCGQPKKGHNCPNQPRPKNQNLQTSEGCCQAELDEDMTMKSLPGEGKGQGFPTSYGLKSWYSSKYSSIPFPVNAIGALQALTNLQGLGAAAGGGNKGTGGGVEVGQGLGGTQLLNQLPRLQQMQLLTQLQNNNNNNNSGGGGL